MPHYLGRRGTADVIDSAAIQNADARLPNAQLSLINAWPAANPKNGSFPLQFAIYAVSA